MDLMEESTGRYLPDIEGIYIHIPFCLKKCHYCDFVSYPVQGLPVDAYCQAVIAEGKLYHSFLSGDQEEIKSIYIGGGTPTCLPAESLVKILDGLREFFPVSKDGEITVECNPQTVSKKYLGKLRAAGVNRLSIGAQSFDSRLLQEMGRLHGVRDIERVVFQAREAGFSNISLDLIYGLPGHTCRQWTDSLTAAAALPVTHISVYGLKLSEESPWGKLYAAGRLDLPDEDLSLEMQEAAMDYLTGQGYVHYEIANFALPGFFSLHNRVYWNNKNYIGLGAAASSHWGNLRQTNCAALSSYLEEVKNGNFPVADREVADREREMEETMFLGLRLLAGLDLPAFARRFGTDPVQKYQRQIEKLVRFGLLAHEGSKIRLTKKGIFLANEVFVEFLS